MSGVIIAGNTSGSITLQAPDVSGSSVLTLPVTTDTLVGKNTTDTLTNKTIVTPVLTVNAINGGQLAGLRNRIINGGMQVAQRGSVAATNGAVIYGGADRFWVAPSGFTTASGTIQQYGSAGAGFGQGLALTSTGSGIVQVAQRIESRNTFDLSSKTITVSAIVYQDSTSTINTSIDITAPNSGVDNWATQTTLVSSGSTAVISGSRTLIKFTTSLSSVAALNGLGVTITFAGVGAVTGRNFYVTELQLEIGSVATPFEQRPYGMELALCQRYYQNAPFAGIGAVSTTTSIYLSITFNMRSIVAIGTPSAAVSINDPALGNFTQSAANATIAAPGNSTGVLLFLGNFTGLTIGRTVFLNTGALIPISAEL